MPNTTAPLSTRFMRLSCIAPSTTRKWSLGRLERFQALTSSFRLIRQIGAWAGNALPPPAGRGVVRFPVVRNLSVRGKIFAGYIAILLMALALLGVAVALTSQTRDLLRALSGDTIPALIALDTLQEAGLRLTNAGDRLAFAAAGAATGQDLPKPRLTALRAVVAQTDRQFKAAIDGIRAVADVQALRAMRPRIVGSAEAMRGHAARLLAQTDGAMDAKAIAATRNAL